MSLFDRLKNLFQRPQTAEPAPAAPKPPVLREIDRLKPARILEIGMGDAARAGTIIEAAAAHRGIADVHYTGIDLFESNPAAPGAVVLRDVHRTLRATGAKIRLMPGEPLEALVQWANSLGKFDMLIFSAGVDPHSLPRVWFFVPRLLEEHAQVYIERAQQDGSMALETVQRAQIETLAAATMPRRKAA